MRKCSDINKSFKLENVILICIKGGNEMGTFAGLLRKKGAGIPDEKKEEFKDRVEKLFQAGGMMEVEQIELCGKKAVTIQKTSMHEKGMGFCYNYFEEDYWEDAGFDSKRGKVWSQKIGLRYFRRVVVAAYVLESLYVDGLAVAMVDNDLVMSPMFTGWINYLFQEHFPQKNNDPWVLFETMHDQDYINLESYEWEAFVQDMDGLPGYFDIKAVLSGTAVVEKEVKKEIKSILGQEESVKEEGKMGFMELMTGLRRSVEGFHKESEQSEAEQLSLIMGMLRSYYGEDKSLRDILEQYKDKYLGKICFFAVLMDTPAYVTKIIAETYDVDFWELWEQVRDVAKRNKLFFKQGIPQEIIPVSTMDFLGVSSDDMIPFWGHDKNIRFSQELKDWFADLKSQFEMILESEDMVDNPLYWILDMMEYADENYYHIYTFSDFFKETIEHLNDRRFLALWKIYDEMLHDPVMEEAGSVIFMPEETADEQDVRYYFGSPPRRRLKTTWGFMGRKAENNKARTTLRRYMALLGNKGLREKVFGF